MEQYSKNAEYLAKLDRSFSDLNAGHLIVKTMDELEGMEDE